MNTTDEYKNILLFLINGSRFDLLKEIVKGLDSIQAQELLFGVSMPQTSEKLDMRNTKNYKSLFLLLEDLSFYTLNCIEDSMKIETLKILFDSDLLISDLCKATKSMRVELLESAGVKKEEQAFILVCLNDRLRSIEQKAQESIPIQYQDDNPHSIELTPKFPSMVDPNFLSTSFNGILAAPLFTGIYGAGGIQNNQHNKEETFFTVKKDKFGHEMNRYSNSLDHSGMDVANRGYFHPNAPSYAGEPTVANDLRLKHPEIRPVYKPRVNANEEKS